MMSKGFTKHKTSLFEPRLTGLSADAWSYAAKKSHEVFVRILRDGKHVVTVSLRVKR